MRSSQEELLTLLEEKQNRERYSRFRYFFPDKTNNNFSALPSGVIHSRDDYTKHVGFMSAGNKYNQRIFMAGNRCGKTLAGAYEMVCHLTGLYPEWWTGKKFHRPINAWACGKTKVNVRDIVQNELLGKRADQGSGMLPKDLIVETRSAPGVPDGVETVTVKHVSGKNSTLTFKGYDSGVEAFVGTAMDVIWLDEECPANIYTECVVRTATTGGIVYITFTPDRGLTETVLLFFDDGKVQEGPAGSRHVTMCSWEDVPHLSEEVKNELYDSIPPHQREAKVHGIPFLGAGAVFPIPEHTIKCAPFTIPEYWPRAYGMDVGWNRTAAIFGAYDQESDTIYLYSEHYRGQAEPSVHAAAIRARGEWLPGVIDKASQQKEKAYGDNLFQLYIEQGLDVEPSDRSIKKEVGLLNMYQKLSEGRIKVFNTCVNWLGEYRIYRRDEKGEIVKSNDHLMDATRYLVDVFQDIMRVNPSFQRKEIDMYNESNNTGRSDIGGY